MKIQESVLLAALVITVILATLSFVQEKGIVDITGLASSGTATTSVNLTEEVSIAVTGSIDWGSGRVDSDTANATLDSNAGTVTGGSWSPVQSYIKVENDGTVNISINVSADGDNNAAGFIGGTNPEFKMIGNVTETGACAGTLVQTFTNIPNSTETPLTICDLLRYGPQDQDEFNVSMKLLIPSDAVSGERNATLTFSASKV